MSASPPEPPPGGARPRPAGAGAGEGAALAPGEIAFTGISDVAIVRRLGEGGRSTVYLGERAGRSVALKVYKPLAVLRHARKHPIPLARFEHERNRAFHEAPGLAPYVAEPIAFLQTDGVAATLQEPLDGKLYYFHHRDTEGRDADRLRGHLTRILELAHAAGLHDVDMHSMNVMVVRGADGLPWPKLFDFNLIPFDVRPPNPVVALLLRTGLMSARHRDLRKLRDFHDFRRVERKLLRFYEPPPGGRGDE